MHFSLTFILYFPEIKVVMKMHIICSSQKSGHESLNVHPNYEQKNEGTYILFWIILLEQITYFFSLEKNIVLS